MYRHDKKTEGPTDKQEITLYLILSISNLQVNHTLYTPRLKSIVKVHHHI